MYDIRRPVSEPDYPDFFLKFLNLPETRSALGIDDAYPYEASNIDVYYAFQQSGDYVYPNFLQHLGVLLRSGIRVVSVSLNMCVEIQDFELTIDTG
jgi:hypothetical protein